MLIQLLRQEEQKGLCKAFIHDGGVREGVRAMSEEKKTPNGRVLDLTGYAFLIE